MHNITARCDGRTITDDDIKLAATWFVNFVSDNFKRTGVPISRLASGDMLEHLSSLFKLRPTIVGFLCHVTGHQPCDYCFNSHDLDLTQDPILSNIPSNCVGCADEHCNDTPPTQASSAQGVDRALDPSLEPVTILVPKIFDIPTALMPGLESSFQLDDNSSCDEELGLESAVDAHKLVSVRVCGPPGGCIEQWTVCSPSNSFVRTSCDKVESWIRRRSTVFLRRCG